ncbi:MAG: HEPN domain-containing protein [Candidatus Aenigmarchaeota archaeon]|nr:HEPN domain-containing protein [Candidatus Aenigmarchaeota archaeon]
MNGEKAFRWCLEKGTGEARKHRGLRRTHPDREKAQKHGRKALHNLKAVDHNLKGGFPDWAVSAAFYAMYRSLLSILAAVGYESRNQECTITAVAYLAKVRQLDFDLNYIAMIRRAEELKFGDAKTLREEFQYGTEVEKEILDSLHKNAKSFVEAAEILVEKLLP